MVSKAKFDLAKSNHYGERCLVVKIFRSPDLIGTKTPPDSQHEPCLNKTKRRMLRMMGLKLYNLVAEGTEMK